MVINQVDRCLGCMQEKSGKQVCPHCSQDEKAQRQPPYLPYGIRLNDQYVVGKVLGHGGFGITYLAWDTRLDRHVAIKEYMPRDFAIRGGNDLSISYFDDGEAMEMFAYGREKFLEEARNLARFNEHPGIVSILYFFEANATAYMVMQYEDGMDLKRHLAQVGGRLPVDVALRIMTPVLDALRAVHDADLLHRDMSPDNIYVTRSKRIMILDFGAARDAVGSHSKSLALIRKPGYSPEEQYRVRGEQGPWTDVYAAAATLYHMLTGNRPPEALDRLVDDSLKPPSELGVPLVSRSEVALMKALSVRAPNRFQSVRQFQDALFGKTPPPSQSSATWYRSQKLRQQTDPSPPPQPPATPSSPQPAASSQQPAAVGPVYPTDVPPDTKKNKQKRSTASWLVPFILLLLLLGGVFLNKNNEAERRQALQEAQERRRAQEDEWQRPDRLLEIERKKKAEEEARQKSAWENRQREEREREAREEKQRQEQAERERREREERQTEQRLRNQASETILSYYAKLNRGDVDGVLSSWYHVKDREALAKSVRRNAEAKVLEIGNVNLAQDRQTADIYVRVRVRNRGESAQTWRGPIRLRRWNNRWEIETQRGLSNESKR